MRWFIGRRLAMLLLALVVSSFVVFISLDVAPGCRRSPAAARCRPRR
jgi:hypothetical protein